MLVRIGAKGGALRLAYGLAAADQRITGQKVDEQEVRVLELEFDGGFVNFHHFAGLAAGRHVGDRSCHDVLVGIEVFEPEHEIIGGEGGAVGPFHALAQIDTDDLAVGTLFP